MANNNWEAWKRQARQLELELDAQLVAYSQLASTRSFGGGNVGGAPSQSAPLTQQSIDAHEYSIHQSLEKVRLSKSALSFTRQADRFTFVVCSSGKW